MRQTTTSYAGPVRAVTQNQGCGEQRYERHGVTVLCVAIVSIPQNPTGAAVRERTPRSMVLQIHDILWMREQWPQF